MLTCSIMLLSSVNTSAQIDTSTTQKLLQYIMQPLDKNQIPTGFLEEYGCPILPMATFNGTLTDHYCPVKLSKSEGSLLTILAS